MSEIARSSHHDHFTQQVSPERFGELRAIARTVARISSGIKTETVFREVRNVERMASLGDATEKIVNIVGYTPTHYDITYIDGAGNSMVQTVVAFVRRTDAGTWDWLHPEDDPDNVLALDAALFDARISSGIHRMYIGQTTTTMPSVGPQGELTGIFTIYEDER